MRNRNFYGGDFRQLHEHRQKSRAQFRVLFGLILAVIGVLLMLRTMGLLPCITFDFSWPVILIIIGFMMGLRSNFRNSAWWILIVIGIANLIPQFTIMGKPSTHYVWPGLIIMAGLALAFRPRRENNCYRKKMMSTGINTEGSLNIDVTFGGRKEIVTSKDFKGGTVSVTFAGCELNLTQADFVEPSVVLDCRVSFGGVEIILPSHWEIQNEISPSFGSVEDERIMQTPTTGENKKILILRGNCSFGSIELKSF